MFTPESVTPGKGADESANKGDPNRSTNSTRDELLDFLVKNLEKINEFIEQKRQAKEQQWLEALHRPRDGRIGEDETPDETEQHHRRRRIENYANPKLAAQMITSRSASRCRSRFRR